MSIETKLLRSSSRDTNVGTQAVLIYRAEETGGTLLKEFGPSGESLSLARIVNDNLTSGPPIPVRGTKRDFNVPNGGVPIELECVEVIARLESCSRAVFQCRFSNFPYWNGIQNPANPDPRVVYLDTGSEIVDSVAKFVKRTLTPEGGNGIGIQWIVEQLIPIRANTGQLRVRVYMPAGVSEGQVQVIYGKIGQIHLISGEKWRFEGASIQEQAGGLVTGDPVFLYYTWTGQNETGALFSGADARDDVWTIPARPAFHRYTWQIDDSTKTPLVSTYLPDSTLVDVPSGWSGLPGDPILAGAPNPT